MTIWPNSLNLGLKLKIFPEISDFFGFSCPFGPFGPSVVVVVGGTAEGLRIFSEQRERGEEEKEEHEHEID